MKSTGLAKPEAVNVEEASTMATSAVKSETHFSIGAIKV